MTPSDAAQRYALALPGVWLATNGGSFAHFGGRPAGPANRAWARKLLADSWGVKDADQLRERLTWLAEKGHTAEWFETRERWRKLPEDQRQGTLGLIHVGLFQAEIGDTGLVAWDAARLINVAGWGFLAGWLTEEEAWSFIIPQARRVQKAYPSWEAFARGYQLGTAYWSAPRADENRAVADRLLADPQSAWRQIPWNTPLGGGGKGAIAASKAEGGGSSSWMWWAGGCAAAALVGGLATCLVAGLVLVAFTAIGNSLNQSFNQVANATSSAGSAAETPEAESGQPERTAASRSAGPSDWDGSSPFECKAADKKTIRGVTAQFDGPAVVARNSCQLTIIDSDITGTIAIQADNAAKITVQGGKLTGSDAAVVATGASKVSLTGTQVNGDVRKKGAAKVEGP
jgi:hypothetical protein